jgi:uncharacterized membrane protein HdeD (DUF308 family)
LTRQTSTEDEIMSTAARELRQLSQTLIWRGTLMFALGSAAAIWPEPVLIGAMIAVGVIATLLGLYEMSIAISVRRRIAGWTLILANGSAAFAFGLLTLGAPRLSLHVGLVIVGLWFLACAGFAWRAAVLWWPLRTLRLALIGWGVVDVALGVLALVYPAATIFALLFFGAVYAAAFGAWQAAEGLWLRRLLHQRPAHHLPSVHAHA